MTELLTTSTAQAVLWILVLCILISAALFLLSKFRDYSDNDQLTPSEALANLQEMHRKGDISEEEFRNITSRTHQHSVDSLSHAEPAETNGSTEDTST